MKYNMPKYHKDKIRCPGCGKIVPAWVFHTSPFYTYFTACNECRFIISDCEYKEEVNDQ